MSIIPSIIAMQAAQTLNMNAARHRIEQQRSNFNSSNYHYDIHGERHYTDDADRQTHRRSDRRN